MRYFKAEFFCGILLCLLQITLSSPTMKIRKSKIIGQTVTYNGLEANQYLGVPYLQPPVGQYRFKISEAIKNYPKEFKAIHNPKACPQYIKDPMPWNKNSTEMDEDCLFLNIWTPADASRKNKKAILFWIHGGGYRTSSINEYNGTRLAVTGDIAVVTVNYRLGFFGFLSSGTQHAAGNAGLYDILGGLEWVAKFCKAFGGDPRRITIAGQGSGAITVGLLSMSELAKPLFRRQIMQSGSPAYRLGDNKRRNVEYSQMLAKKVGCATDSFTIEDNPDKVLDCLRGIDAKTITKADFDLTPRAVVTLLPEYGFGILKENPREEIMEFNSSDPKQGEFECKDLLIGSVKNEGSVLLTAFELQDTFGVFGEKNPHIDRQTGQEIIRNLATGFPDVGSIVDYYLPPNLTDDTDYRIRSQVVSAAGDLVLLCPTVYYAEKCAEQDRNVYYYEFAHRSSVSPWAPWMGVVHMDDVPFVFGQPLSNSKYQSSEHELSEKIIEIWSSFVKYGKPNIPWPLYSKESQTYKILGPDSETGNNGENGPKSQTCEFLEPFFKN